MITKKDGPCDFGLEDAVADNDSKRIVEPQVDLDVLVAQLKIKLIGSKQQNKSNSPFLQTAFVTGFETFNLHPSRGANGYLKKANFSSSIAGALTKDWKKVGNDLKQAKQKYFALNK